MIDKDLDFISFLNFCKNKKKIRQKYLQLDYEKKFYYKMYVYSIPFEKEYVKDLIWEYLNAKWDWLVFADADLMSEFSKRKEIKL